MKDDTKTITDRIAQAVMATPDSERGYVLRKATDPCAALSFSDLMTDLGPFIAAEIERAAKDECAAIVEICKRFEFTEDALDLIRARGV